ncbi:PREDICTED: disease resistance protein RML1A-like [Prunus mume]|uniref:Disease resistance protein RML1A-like n=1 Tax=Prunus mume TaxID=102107 RepID=A0ABM1LHP9_PRUMU|nr:PREDICTED: disease resistance protein RML1A-like [Prunus mume]
MADRTSIEAPSSRTWKYQVFLSFRGEDTRKGFTGHLHAALSDAGIRAFLDDNELERAEFIKNQLEQAIHGSMISIIVFSKRYADSSWCLDELVKIMECRERLGQKVIPLFYNVDPSDVRKQTGSFAQAFEKHEAGICEGKHEKEKVQRWRNALTQAANLCGEDLKNADNGHEAKFINKIIGVVVNKQLYSKYRLDIKHPVGITSRVRVLSNYLDIENSGSKDVVRMIGIWGMGGIGKTTLAKAIYNEFEGSFEGRSFLENVREVIANQPMGLVRLQKQLLNDILKSKGPKKVDSVPKGIEMIRKRLPCKRALVIIDDADDLHQLEAIAGARDWFGPGSRIVITTRNKHLLEQVGVDSTCIAEKMDEEEALEFFSWHAFKRGYPNQEYLDLSKRVIRYCQGLPLALRVVGSFLIRRSIAEWESHLEKLQRSPDGDIQKILRISYDGLPDHTTRKIFLDISCFFIGMDKDYVTQILDGCKFSAVIGISVLSERCLVTVSEQNKLMMHDLLRDMGREIIRKKAHGHPKKFSRLWKCEDVTDVLSNESGTEKIEGVALHLDLDVDSDLESDVDSDLDSYLDLNRFSAQAFTKMTKLRLLHLIDVKLTGEYKDFPKSLIWLCWRYFPLESIPDDFPVQPNLVALDLQWSKLKIVWKDCKLHQNLKILNLSHSYQLTKSPDFSKLPNLKELILEDCESLSEVHSSIGDLGRLSLVDLKSCRMLKDLPLNFYKSKSIKTLILNGCSSFGKLAEGLGDMVSLTTLKADVTAIRQIPSSILKLKKLKALSLCYVKGSPSTNLLPPSLHSLSSLRELALARNDFCSLPSLSRLSQLQDLSLHNCINLRAIPDLPTRFLKVLKASGCIALEKMPDFSEMSNIRELYLSDSCKLTEIPGLYVRDSVKLTEVPGLYKSLNFMTRIHMEKCTNLTADFRKNILQGQLSNDELKLQDGDKVLIEIIIDKWVEVKKTGVSLVWDKFMNENMIDYHLCAYERRPSQNLVNDDDIIHVEDDHDMTKSPDFSKFPNLEKLILKGCDNLFKVHSSIGDLGRLSLVNLEGCIVLCELPLNFYKSKSIETLILNGCSWFEDLTDGLGDMASLTILEADDTLIRQIPSSIVKLKKLRILSLYGCWLTEDAIPKDLCSLISLEHLLLGDNDFSSLPSLAGLSKLKVLCLNACTELRAIPDLPINLYVLKANDCPELETIPDFSKMWNMRELYLRDSVKLTEVPGLDKSLNSMTRIHMEGCECIASGVQRWTSCGFGGIYLNGIYDIPEWFKIVNHVDNIVFFEVPQRIMGRDLKGLTICIVYSSFVFGRELEGPIGIIVRNLTKKTALHTKIAFARKGRPEPHSFLSNEPENDYLWQGQLSNDVLHLQGGDQVSILVRPLVDFARVKKTGVHLEWDKVMKENMDNPDPHLYALETNQDFLEVSAIDEESAVEANPLGHGDLCTRLSLSIMENLDFSGGADDGAGRSHGASNQSSAVDKQLEWDEVMKDMDHPDPHLYDLETNRDFAGGVDDAFVPNQTSVIHEQGASMNN